MRTGQTTLCGGQTTGYGSTNHGSLSMPMASCPMPSWSSVQFIDISQSSCPTDTVTRSVYLSVCLSVSSSVSLCLSVCLCLCLYICVYVCDALTVHNASLESPWYNAMQIHKNLVIEWRSHCPSASHRVASWELLLPSFYNLMIGWPFISTCLPGALIYVISHKYFICITAEFCNKGVALSSLYVCMYSMYSLLVVR